MTRIEQTISDILLFTPILLISLFLIAGLFLIFPPLGGILLGTMAIACVLWLFEKLSELAAPGYKTEKIVVDEPLYVPEEWLSSSR